MRSLCSCSGDRSFVSRELDGLEGGVQCSSTAANKSLKLSHLPPLQWSILCTYRPFYPEPDHTRHWRKQHTSTNPDRILLPVSLLIQMEDGSQLYTSCVLTADRTLAISCSICTTENQQRSLFFSSRSVTRWLQGSHRTH